MVKKKKRGRPKVKIDLTLVESLANIQCTIKEISAVMKIPASTLQDREDFSFTYKRGLENGKASLRRMQWKIANNGNATMCIWLGKQILGQTDSPLVDNSKHYYQVTLEGLIKNVHNSHNESEANRTGQVSLSRVAEVSNN